jgi:hypothetical protein
VLSAALILNRIPAIVGLDQLSLPAGLLQRAAGAVEIVLAVIIALAALRVTPTRHGHTVELPRSAR